MIDSSNPTTAANGNNMLRSSDNEEEGSTPSGGYRYTYYLTNQTYSGTLSGDLCLKHYSKDKVIESETWDDTLDGDEYVCIGVLYDRADDITIASGGHLGVGKGASASNVVLNRGGSITLRSSGQCGSITFAGGSIATEQTLSLSFLTFSSQDATFLTPYNDDGTYYSVDNWGGAVRATGTANLSNCKFYSNTCAVVSAAYNRDSFGYDDTPNMTIDGCYFQDNSDMKWGTGGAVSGHNLTVKFSDFVRNQAGMCGGAIDGSGSITGSYFTYNSVSGSDGNSGGGAVCCSGDITLQDCAFFYNSASYGGAVINIYENTLKVSDCDFTNNFGSFGGAISNSRYFFDLNLTPVAMVSGSTFTENQAQTRGGAIDNEYKLTVEKSLFSGNYAGGSGGAISNSVYYSMWESSYSDTFANISGSTFYNNDANEGGAIDNGSHFTGTNLTVTENSAYRGGGIANSGEWAEMSVSGSELSGNSASYGGAVYNYGSSKAALSNISFEGNYATLSGGAVYNGSSAEMTISNSTFSGNSSGGNGGAIYNTATITVSNSSFLTASDTIYNYGNMTWTGSISLAGNVTAYETIDASGAKVVFDLTNRLPSSNVLFNNLNFFDCSDLAISISSDQIGETFKLGGNAVKKAENDPDALVNLDGAFSVGYTTALGNMPVKVYQDGAEIGQFIWNRLSGMYDSFVNGDTRYSLGISLEGELYLKTEILTLVNYAFTDVGQTVYYNGEKPDGCTLEGVLMAIPYTADITVTFNKKNLVDGLYDFTTSIAEVPGSVNRFRIQVSDAGSGDTSAQKTVSYISDNKRYDGTAVGETGSTVTYKFTCVEDHVLTDTLLNTMTMDAGADIYAAKNGLLLSTNKIHTGYVLGDKPDVDKTPWWGTMRFTGIFEEENQSTGIVLTVTNKKYDYSATMTINGQQYDCFQCIVSRDYNETRNITTIDAAATGPDQELFTVSVSYDWDSDTLSMSHNGKERVNDDRRKISLGPGEEEVFAKEDMLHCWIATACNMMEAGGYLDLDPQQCYRILNMRYFREDGNASIGASAYRVFHDFLYKKKNLKYDEQTVCYYFNNNTADSIYNGLDNVSKGNGIVAEINFRRMDTVNDAPSHVITCYGVTMISNEEIELTCVDSDDLKTQTKTIRLKKYESTLWNWLFHGKTDKTLKGKWYYEDPLDHNIRYVIGVTTLIPQKKDETSITLSKEDIEQFDIGKKNNTIYANQHAGCSIDDVGITVAGFMNDSIVMDEGFVTVSAGGEVEEMVVHDGGAVSFSSGSIAKGTIRSVGGVLTVESGVDVSEAEFDFAVSRMDGGNNTVLLNSLSNVSGAKLTITIVNGQSAGKYVLAGGASDFDGALSVVGEYDYTKDVKEGFNNGMIGNLGLENTLKIEGNTFSLAVEEDKLVLTIAAPPQSEIESQAQVFGDIEAESYVVEYSMDNFEHVVQITTDSLSLDSFLLPAGTFQWRVKPEGEEEWSVGEPVSAAEEDPGPKLVKSNEDGNMDVFFANTTETWEKDYFAQHAGSIGDWNGTREIVPLFGKNKLADFFVGSTDANILLMTDDENGDTLFVDDIFTGLPGTLKEQQARIALIDEILAGAGDDIVDMTSQRFEYIGSGLIIRGGDGDDVIWASKGDNLLFGDAGNDRIVGASGNDVIVGGTGNDTMHGGGGNDMFMFCGNWGSDTVEQLEDGGVTLWFADGDESKWNKETLTYTDGENSVSVKGVTTVSLKFGDDGSDLYAGLASAGAFAEFTSQRIFEESKGLLAGQ